ncbi:uncharacterized protein BDZ99DRAFT_467159 [Mytilinidion resinicola]|uniref:ER-bound oxygenase mpaB/mpaB'/Rubber oxygenase catalytic domain-containing protein n=1 Tax=Mytilinidion resinicola TaxID=574789 RepID=A0A6A6Y9Z2_9PEZI|nr:uncharacterized protein BDZ99DRAFT_467159 [Mytilinidion resinicola]KAF2804935.1 hypothetical protein BDZ99DRAFT_467159 [Mytilinidion resinicola]
MEQKHAKYPYKTRESYSKMTATDAYEIGKYVFSLEFPFTSEKAAQFALFRTYGVPTISKTLCETKQLAEPVFASRRYADTAILINEFVGNAPDSDRAISAISRMNYLHEGYRKAGKISNDDMIYTLALFVLETDRWIRNYEWRPLTDMELCAFGTQWKNIGDAMGIDLSALKHGPNNFQDGLEFAHDLAEWVEDYEQKNLIPDPYNHKLANETTAILIYNLPGFLKGPAKKLVTTMMDERLRKAMIYPAAPAPYHAVKNFALSARKFLLKNFFLPRPYFLRFRAFTEEPNSTGRYERTFYETEPWYIPETFGNRWSLEAWVRWLAGRPIPGGGKYKPEGYHFHEVGPKKMEGKGLEHYKMEKGKLYAAGRGGCPFAVAKG